jgi:RNA polymerase sigma factor (sigma-70 family)
MTLIRSHRRNDESTMLSAREPPPRTVIEWVESRYLSRVVSRVAHQYGLPLQDVPDLLQEVRLALWIAGPTAEVNATWVFHTANHKTVDVLNRRRRRVMEEARVNGGKSALVDNRNSDLRHLLRSRASRLPEALRRFYFLRYEAGLSEREIAQRLRCCRSSVRWLDHQCLRMIRGRASYTVQIRGGSA